MIKNVFVLLFLMTTSLFSADFKAVAKVNNQVVTNYDLDNFSKIVKLYMTDTKIDNTRNKALDSYIDVLLRGEAAELENINFDKEEFDAFKNTIESNVDFAEKKKQLGINQDFYENLMKKEFMWGKLIEERIRPSIGITVAEVNESLEYLSGDSIRTRYSISEITIYRPPNSDTKPIVDKLYKEISEKDNFEDLAEKFSQSGTKDKKGFMGWVDESDVNSDIANALRNMSVGKTSKPIYFGDDNSGYYMLVKLNDKKTERVKKDTDFNRAQYFIYNKKLNIGIKDYIDRLYYNSFIEIY